MILLLLLHSLLQSWLKALNMAATIVVAILLAGTGVCNALYTGAFMDGNKRGWQIQSPASAGDKVQFYIGMKSQLEPSKIHNLLLDVSTPSSKNYGKHWSLKKVQDEIMPLKEKKVQFKEWLAVSLGPGAAVDVSGAFIKVTASALSVEAAFGTKLHWHQQGSKRALRAVRPLRNLPKHLEEQASFITLNSPIVSLKESALTTSKEAASTTISVSSGNKEALVYFKMFCSDGLINQKSPPCEGSEGALPKVLAVAELYNNNRSDPFSLLQDPIVVDISQAGIACYNSYTASKCDGNTGNNCTCVAKVAPLPKYQQIKIALYESTTKNGTESLRGLGNSTYFSLTDVATPDLLSALYGIPKGLSVKHGSTQACAEFYGTQYFSNSDLAAYMSLNGLQQNPISPEDCFGSLPYNASIPAGGEAQLDVELLQGLALGARTSFYNYDEANPESEGNEGFLTWCNTVSQQTSPPLVFSVSYGDLEASVFNSSVPGAYEYGMAVDEQFMIMGLRGLTVVFSSGDDGLGSSLIRTDTETACSQAWPEWPASSPYVLAVGATQLTDKPNPICGKPYAIGSAGVAAALSAKDYLLAECSLPAETVCTAALGGVITSGGGFSNVWNREKTAPWQSEAVAAYLSSGSALPSSSGFFNLSGRAYPDVATYGSNFFVYLNGNIVRESGTSGSAPVMAAMITLWNDARLAYGLPPLGFINPWLYAAAASHPEAFRDVTTGNNACGAGGGLSTAHCCSESFPASPGWDAATGLGTPKFQTLANLAVNNAALFPSWEQVDAALPSPAPSAAPSSSASAPSSDSSSSGSASSDSSDQFAPLSANGVAGAALFFSLVNSLVLAVGAYQWYRTRGAYKAAPLIVTGEEGDKGSSHALYNPLASSVQR